MNDIMKAIAILQCLRDTMRARHRPNVPYGQDLSEEIDQLAEAIALLSPPEDESAEEPEQQPNTPPAFGPWQSCKDGIDAEDGDWVLYAWHSNAGWQYAAAQVSCDCDDEDESGTFELLDWDDNQVELEPSDYYMKVKQ